VTVLNEQEVRQSLAKAQALCLRPAPLHFAKEAGVKDVLRRAVQWGKTQAVAHKPEIVGGLIGAGAGAGVGALVTRRPKGKPSLLERHAARELAGVQEEDRKHKKSGKSPGLAHGMAQVGARTWADMTKLMADHPVAASLLVANTGRKIGSTTGRYVKEWSR
jgi:hypothetical protein